MGALAELGITDRQEQVYLELVDRPGCGLDHLVTRTGLARSTVARTLTQLQHDGLATRMPGREAHYSPVAPTLALQMLVRRRSERLDEARAAVAALGERFEIASRLDGDRELVEVVHGGEEVHRRWVELQRSARSVIRAFDKPPYIASGNAAEPGMLRQGVEYRTIYDRAALDVPGKLDGIFEAFAAGENCRIGPALPLKLFIGDERMAFVPLRGGGDLDSALVVHTSALLSALIALFESFWARAVPVHDHAAMTHDGLQLTEVQRHLLDLLDAGLTDEAIARRLGLGYRTVQRRISELMALYGAKTRYQLGVQTRIASSP